MKWLRGIVLSLLFATAALAQVGQIPSWPPVQIAPSGAANNILLDATSTVQSQTTASSAVTLTTTVANTILIACLANNSAALTSIADTATLTWTQIGSVTGRVQVWRATASGTLSGDTITATWAASTFNTIVVAAFSGVNATPLDANGALPGTTTTNTAALLTTSSANDALFACYQESSGTTTPGAGWTGIQMGSFIAFEYKKVTATQAGTAANLATGTINSGIAHALVSN